MGENLTSEPVDLNKGSPSNWDAYATVILIATGAPVTSTPINVMTIGELMVTEKSSGSSSSPAPIITGTAVTAQTCSIDASSVAISANLPVIRSGRLASQQAVPTSAVS